MNKSELARACGVDPSAINKLESGDTQTISGELLLRISLATGVSPFEILEMRQPGSSSRASRAAELLEQLPEEKQAEILHYLAVEARLKPKKISAGAPDLAESLADDQAAGRLR